ncbi:MAG TPA: hypothetical protein VFK90_00245, partial [Anaeromyxobacter sp.]|nr:hypothetical protein [Anaeromyxobacter sp.]
SFGETERAIAAYEAALAADPKDVQALAALATCVAAARGDDAASEHDVRVVLAWEASPAAVPAAAEAPSRYRLGLALVREGRLSAAVPHLERAVVLAPSDARAPEAGQALARGHVARGEDASALAAARARVNRAAALGPPSELAAAIVAERESAADLGVAVPPLPPAAARAIAERAAGAVTEGAAAAAGGAATESAAGAATDAAAASAAETATRTASAAASATETAAASAAASAAATAAAADSTAASEPGSGPEAEPETEVDLAAGDAAFADDGTEETGIDLAAGDAAFADEPAREGEPAPAADMGPAALAAALVSVAEALARDGAPEAEVRAALDRACDADPDSPVPWRARARIEGALGDPIAAGRAHLAVSIRAEGEEAAASALEAASLFEDAGRHADAARAYRAALHARPGSVPAPLLLAEEALAAGDAEAAAGLLVGFDASGLGPDAAGRHARRLARTLDAVGSAGEAERAWLGILRAAPADAEAFARAGALALAARGVGAWEEVATAHEEALAAAGDADRRRDLRQERARLLAEAGRLEAARAAYLSALELDPGHFPTIEALSALDARRDEWAAAVGALWEEAAQAGDDAEAAGVYVRLARILSDRLDDAGGAIAALRAALARARSGASPDAGPVAAQAEALLGELGAPAEPPPAEAPGAPQEGDAVADVLRAQADAAEGAARADLLERLASHLERAGDRDAAAEALVEAIQADPQRDATWSWLLALAPDDEERIARAEVARAGAETAVSLAETGEEPDSAAPWEAPTAAPAMEPPEPELLSIEGLDGEPPELAPPPELASPADRRTQELRLADVLVDDLPAPPPQEVDDDIDLSDLAEDLAPAGTGAAPGGEEAAPTPPEPAMPEEAFALGEPDSEAAGIEVDSEPRALASYRPEDLARDGRLRYEAGDLEGAFDQLSLALAREPSDLTVARDLSRIAERLGRDEEYVTLGEMCADAVAAYDPLAAAARFRQFAGVLREKLGNPERAAVMLEKALALVPDDADTRRELNHLWSGRPETARRALESWLEIARRDPADAGALAGVARVCATLSSAPSAEGAARAAEQGRIAASMAAFVAPAANLAPTPARVAPAIADELRTRAAVPGAVGPLGRLLELLAPWLEPLFPADLRRRGATASDRLVPPRAPALGAAMEAAARALSTRAHAVFVTGREGFELALENTQPPAVVASLRLAALPDAALAFLAARSLDLLGRGWTLAGKFAPKDVGILLELACRFAGGAPPPLGLPEQRAGAFLAVLRAQVPPETRAAAAELAATEPRAFAAALRRSANRVALLHAGDPGPALHALALLDRRLEGGAAPDPVQALALPDLRDLALFALSEPFLDLRAAALG